MCIELAYVNTKHPDFTEASLVHRALTETLDNEVKKLNIRENMARQGTSVPAAEEVVSNNASKRVVCWASLNCMCPRHQSITTSGNVETVLIYRN